MIDEGYEASSSPSMTYSAKISQHKQGKKEQCDFFTILCEQIEDCIRQQKPIQDDQLQSFSRTAILLLEGNFDINTSSFKNLAQLVFEYMHYGLEYDADKQRLSSYARLSQIIDTLKTFLEERAIEIKAHQEALKHPEYAELLDYFSSPESVVYRLSCETDETAKKYLQMLKQGGFVVEGGIHNNKHYILSELGDALYKNLCQDFDHDWVDQWTYKRIAVLCWFLLSLNQEKYSLTVREVVQVLSECSESVISAFFEHIKPKLLTFTLASIRRVKELNSFQSCFDISSTLLANLNTAICEANVGEEVQSEEQKLIQWGTFERMLNA